MVQKIEEAFDEIIETEKAFKFLIKYYKEIDWKDDYDIEIETIAKGLSKDYKAFVEKIKAKRRFDEYERKKLDKACQSLDIPSFEDL